MAQLYLLRSAGAPPDVAAERRRGGPGGGAASRLTSRPRNGLAPERSRLTPLFRAKKASVAEKTMALYAQQMDVSKK